MDRIKKQYVLIGISIFILLSILYILNGFYWRAKCNQTMELFGTAMINRDLDLLDTLIDQECEMCPTEGKDRQYQYQRNVIAKIWETKEYTITLYHYKYIEKPHDFWSIFEGTQIGGICELRIVDAGGVEYWLLITMIINRHDDGKIIRTTAFLDTTPNRW